MILTEDLQVCCVGHSFGPKPDGLGGPAAYYVQDFLVDQSQSTGGGAFMADPIQFDLTRSTGYRYRISAACGKHFVVNLPAGATNAYFSGYLGRHQINPPGGVFAELTPQLSYEGLVGAPPTLTYNEFFITQGDNSALEFDFNGPVTTNFEFKSMALRAHFSRAFDSGAKWYNPLSGAVPIGAKDIYPKSETFVMFGYDTSNPVDPGPFVSLSSQPHVAASPGVATVSGISGLKPKP
jgi:hypothetical protein